MEQHGVGEPNGLERIWTPHRMEYIRTSVTSDEGCPFCTIPTLSDEDGLVVARGEAACIARTSISLPEPLSPSIRTLP